MNSNPQRQQGVTLIGWIVILAIIGFFVLLALRLGPAYIENYSVKKALESLENDPEAYSLSVQQTKSRMDGYFNINYITTVPREAVKIKKSGGTLKVEIDYEVRVPILGNIDAIMTFSDKAEITAN